MAWPGQFQQSSIVCTQLAGVLQSKQKVASVVSWPIKGHTEDSSVYKPESVYFHVYVVMHKVYRSKVPNKCEIARRYVLIRPQGVSLKNVPKQCS